MSTDRPLRTSMEQKLSDYWCELLGVERVGPEAQFFELGGNSLLATMLANRIEEDLGIRPTMTDLFNTLEKVAAICDALLVEQGG